MADAEDPVFAATLTDVRHFTNLLRSVAFQQRVKIVASAAGLMVQVEEARTLQCKSYIPASTFASWVFNPRAAGDDADHPDEDDVLTPPPPPDVALEINLSHLIECLNIFGGAGAGGTAGLDGEGRKRRGSSGENEDDQFGGYGVGDKRRAEPKAGKITAGRISWMGPGEPLEVVLVDESADYSPVTTCSLSTSDADFEADIEFPEDEEPSLHIITLATWLKDALLSLDPSASKVTLASLAPPPSSTFFTPPPAGGAPPKPAQDGGVDFRIESQGTWGDVRMDFENKRPLCLSFVRHESVKATFRKTLLQRALRALALAQKVSLQLHPSGVLFLQCMISPPLPAFDEPGGGGAAVEAERARRKEARRRGEEVAGIVELRMMSLEEESDDDD